LAVRASFRAARKAAETMNDALATAPVPLSIDRHGMRRWRRFSDYGFVRGKRNVPVVLAEADLVAAAMPLVFAAEAHGGVPSPVALLRISAETTPFVDTEGRWLAPYVPAIVRVHPFSARPAQDSDARMILLVDEADGFVTDNAHDARFFDPFGALDTSLEPVVTFFQQYEVSSRATRVACAALANEGLFHPLDPQDAGLSGLLGIDRARLSALDDAAYLRLRAAGALELAHAHFIGRTQLAFLRRAEAALAAGATPGMSVGLAGNTGARTSSDVSDFLAALSASQDDDAQADIAPAHRVDAERGQGRGQE
jgi:hypothetical protein